MPKLHGEPPESMYVQDDKNFHYKRHKTIWQAVHGDQKETNIFIEAETPEEAETIFLKIFKIRGHQGSNYQFRRLPITEIKEKKTK